MRYLAIGIAAYAYGLLQGQVKLLVIGTPSSVPPILSIFIVGGVAAAALFAHFGYQFKFDLRFALETFGRSWALCTSALIGITFAEVNWDALSWLSLMLDVGFICLTSTIAAIALRYLTRHHRSGPKT